MLDIDGVVDKKNVKAIRKSELERRREVRSDPPRVQGHQDHLAKGVTNDD